MNKRIRLIAPVDVTNTKNALIFLKQYYEDAALKFLGWSSGKKVISIDNRKYFLSSILNNITLVETNTNVIYITEHKKAKYEEYNSLL